MSKRKKMNKLPVLCLLSLCFSFLLSGCLLKPVEDLYTLPRASEAYYNLQTEIEKVVTGDVEYCAPTSGENRQPLQMVDLNGDGTDEAIVFARDTTEKPLKIFIFSRTGDTFQLSSTIHGVGSSYDSVSYVQVDGSPGQEILVGRAISEQVLKSVSVYNFQGNSTVELMAANYTAYTTFDLDADGRQDLFLVRFESETQTGAVELYRYRDGLMDRDPEQRLSGGVTAVRRIITGFASEGVPAVFVAGTLDENLIRTDVFAVRDDTLQNILPTEEADSLTVRNYYVYSSDIDNDGLIELPEVSALPRAAGQEDGPVYRLIHWYNLDPDGNKEYKMLTYHDYSHGFYVELNSMWKGNITVARDDSVEEGTSYRFSRWMGVGNQEEEIFTIYLLSGDHRAELAEKDDRFLLADKNDVSFAASLGDSLWARGITEQMLRESFRFISIDWNSGEM